MDFHNATKSLISSTAYDLVREIEKDLEQGLRYVSQQRLECIIEQSIRYGVMSAYKPNPITPPAAQEVSILKDYSFAQRAARETSKKATPNNPTNKALERSADECLTMQETNMAVFMIGGKAYTLRGEGVETVWEHMKVLESRAQAADGWRPIKDGGWPLMCEPFWGLTTLNEVELVAWENGDFWRGRQRFKLKAWKPLYKPSAALNAPENNKGGV